MQLQRQAEVQVGRDGRVAVDLQLVQRRQGLQGAHVVLLVRILQKTQTAFSRAEHEDPPVLHAPVVASARAYLHLLPTVVGLCRGPLEEVVVDVEYERLQRRQGTDAALELLHREVEQLELVQVWRQVLEQRQCALRREREGQLGRLQTQRQVPCDVNVTETGQDFDRIDVHATSF